MISIVITSFREPKTGRAIDSFIKQKIKESYEIVVAAPDKETQDLVKRYSKKYKQVKLFKDPGKGKSFALNLLLPKLKGRILIFTDGDVFVSENSVNEIIQRFEDSEVGCVTGRPIPLENRKTKYGYYANFLFDSANKLRSKTEEKRQFVECSGYLFAFRRGIINKIPLDVAEDTIIPMLFYLKGFKISYAPEAEVFVKNVDNLHEWLKQKIRTTKAHENISKYVDLKKIPRSKSFLNEVFGGFYLFTYPKNTKEIIWTLELFMIRLYMWFVVWYHTRVKNKKYADGWERIESTK